jgi:hypothetical protein
MHLGSEEGFCNSLLGMMGGSGWGCFSCSAGIQLPGGLDGAPLQTPAMGGCLPAPYGVLNRHWGLEVAFDPSHQFDQHVLTIQVKGRRN